MKTTKAVITLTDDEDNGVKAEIEFFPPVENDGTVMTQAQAAAVYLMKMLGKIANSEE